MPLKSKITKTEFEALHDVLKEHYKEDGDAYILDDDGRRELMAAKQRETERANRATADIAALRSEMDALRAEREAERDAEARKKNDLPALEAAWQKKLDDQKKKDADALKRREDQLRALLVRNVAIQIANDVSNDPEILLPHIERQIAADLDGEEPKTVFLDEKGQKTAKSLEDFRQEIVDNKKFAAIIVGSKASGGGADQRKATGGGAPVDFSKMTETERTALARRNPEQFKQLAKAAGAPLR